MDPYVPEPPSQLYSVARLFDEFSADDPLSWTKTLDGRAFQSYVRCGRREPSLDIAKRQAAHDSAITSDLTQLLVGLLPVAIMGGHQMIRGDDGYHAVARIARELTIAGFTVLTGGGPGAMEAAHLGARFAKRDGDSLAEAIGILAADAWREFPIKQESDLITRSGEFDTSSVQALHAWQVPAFNIAQDTDENAGTSIGIPTWLYGHEPPTPFATSHAKYFANSIREDGLLAVALYGVVYAPGSAGTLQEIYQDAAQNYYRSVGGIFSPMIFLDTDQIWTAKFAVDTTLQRLFKPEDYRSMVEFVDDPGAAVSAILGRKEQIDLINPAP